MDSQHFSRFFLAGPFDRRAEMADVAAHISARSAWECTSSWLHENVDDQTVQATTNLMDLATAQVLVIYDGESTEGGMWAELGMALADGMPVVFVTRRLSRPLYTHHPLVSVVLRATRNERKTMDAVCSALDTVAEGNS